MNITKCTQLQNQNRDQETEDYQCSRNTSWVAVTSPPRVALPWLLTTQVGFICSVLPYTQNHLEILFSVRLLPLNITFVRFIHADCFIAVHLFSWLHCLTLYEYIQIIFILSTVDEHLGSFQFGDITNSSARYNLVRVFW